MPITMMLISWPACVNSMSRRSTFAIQSMFSVPLSIAIFAPAESANHSSGTRICSAMSSAAMMRAHSGLASDPTSLLGSPRMMTRVIPSGNFSVTLRTSPTTTFAVFCPYGPVDRHELAIRVRDRARRIRPAADRTASPRPRA